MDISSFVLNHALFFVLGLMTAGAISPTLKWLKIKDSESWVAMVQRAGPLMMALLFVVALYLVLGPGGWVWADFTHYQNEVICFPSTWGATLRPLSVNPLIRFEYGAGHVVYYGPDNATTMNWSGTFLNWTNKTNALINQSPIVVPTEQ